MIRMVILPLSVVLLAASGYLDAADKPKDDAQKCSPGLGDYITRVCSSAGTRLADFSSCSYTCESTNDKGQITRTTRFMPDGTPCGDCKECCGGTCSRVHFNFQNWLTLKSCPK
ncbi:uncharacterized protein LOC120846678 [Ixodes scapularis]|uniref:uncharacterized protein LOC120846678 n=1 Tax=Ixodes scapularis TaxID=6945 RepID=UPI001A9FE1B8|nr:uncharacterized protein LOC120846678 [Ixodes scapularis]